ncbi:MAG: malectin, partial [Oscillospiraceae bacterium]|nr:malectin [Oscillospiraceae bacterium]
LRFSVLRIDCGAAQTGEYEDSNGNLWVPDKPYFSGSWGYTRMNGGSGAGLNGVPQANADGAPIDWQLYRTTRWGAPLIYQFDCLEPGDYTVNFYHVEDFHDNAGLRLFDVWIYDKNDETNTIKCVNELLNDRVDLVALGGKFKPFHMSVEYTVKENSPLVIELEAPTDNGIIAAIEFIKK